ncbi:hypothetical protein HPG69_001715 [Diceros bicornis minor]|uniref:Uncharacterized protein n=1 Tax=Diceros bicornis minor TaxID=77932 RepID=A0A7J7FBC9_DICBM|nr:hypothetical protein HPG69_001715 [Diceros bicornis minor]
MGRKASVLRLSIPRFVTLPRGTALPRAAPALVRAPADALLAEFLAATAPGRRVPAGGARGPGLGRRPCADTAAGASAGIYWVSTRSNLATAWVREIGTWAAAAVVFSLPVPQPFNNCTIINLLDIRPAPARLAALVLTRLCPGRLGLQPCQGRHWALQSRRRVVPRPPASASASSPKAKRARKEVKTRWRIHKPCASTPEPWSLPLCQAPLISLTLHPGPDSPSSPHPPPHAPFLRPRLPEPLPQGSQDATTHPGRPLLDPARPKQGQGALIPPPSWKMPSAAGRPQRPHPRRAVRTTGPSRWREVLGSEFWAERSALISVRCTACSDGRSRREGGRGVCMRQSVHI